MALSVVPYEIKIDHDGKEYPIRISGLSVPKCSHCGALSFDEEASLQIDRAFRRQAGLLNPEEIRRGRIGVGYSSQQEFAACLGISVSTVSRWENGGQIQQSFYNDCLQAFFECPEFRRFMAIRHGLTPKNSERIEGEEAIPLCN